MSSAKKIILQFSHKDDISPGVFSFYFMKPSELDYTAGQYLQLTLPHDNPDERGTQRYFSISSGPQEADLILTIKNGKSSFKKKLFSLQKGETVEGFGPMGQFVLED